MTWPEVADHALMVIFMLGCIYVPLYLLGGRS